MILEVFFNKSALANGQATAESYLTDTFMRLNQDVSSGTFKDMGSTLWWQREVSRGYDGKAFTEALNTVINPRGLSGFKTDYTNGDGMISVNVRARPA